jgi:type IV fimbrial biogenesis protein FimT
VHRYLPLSRSDSVGFGLRLKQAGFSLYDLMVTSVVAGVMGIGTIGVTGLVQDTRMTTAVNQLIGDLSLARSESIKRQTVVTLCKSGDGASCADDGGWHNGWIVFADENNNHAVDADEAIIHVQQRLDGNLTLRYGETGSYGYVRYKPNGEAWPGATFSFCDGRGASKAKGVIVYWTGRPRVTFKTSEGKPLSCT